VSKETLKPAARARLAGMASVASLVSSCTFGQAIESPRASPSPSPEPTPTQPILFIPSEFLNYYSFVEETTGFDVDLLPLLPSPLRTQDGMEFWLSKSRLNADQGDLELPLLVIQKGGILLDVSGITRVESQIPILREMDEEERTLVGEVNAYLDKVGDIVDVYLGVKLNSGLIEFSGPALSANNLTNTLRTYNRDTGEWEELIGGSNQVTLFKEALNVQVSPIPLPTRTPVPTVTPVPTETLTPEELEERLLFQSLSPWDIRRMKWTQAQMNPEWEDGIPGIYCPISDLSKDLSESCSGSPARTEITLQIMIDVDLYDRTTFPVREVAVNPYYGTDKGAEDFANGVAFIVSLLKNGARGFKRIPVNMDLQAERRSDGNWWVPLQFYPSKNGPNFRDFDPKMPIVIILKDRGYYHGGVSYADTGIGVIPDTHQLVMFLTLDTYSAQRMDENEIYRVYSSSVDRMTPLFKIADLHARQLCVGCAEVDFTPEAKVQIRKYSTIVYGRSFLKEDVTDQGFPPGLLLAVLEE